MIPQDKPSELQLTKTLIMATLDYLDERLGASFTLDQNSSNSEYCQQQKLLTEKYFKLGSLDSLKEQFACLAQALPQNSTSDFTTFIKERTGLHLDPIADLRKRVSALVAQDYIHSFRELSDAFSMQHLYTQLKEEGQEVEMLSALLGDASKRSSELINASIHLEDDGTIVATGFPSSESSEERGEEISPDGERTLCITKRSFGSDSSTYITVQFPTASGPIYRTTSVDPGIDAWWKDNTTIVIETNNEYEAAIKHDQVSSFDDIITIEYVEIGSENGISYRWF